MDIPSVDICSRVRRYWKPRDARPMVEWCEENIYIPAKHAFMSGPWVIMNMPHLRGVFWLMENAGIREIDMQWGTRLGKTTTLIADLMHASENEPSPSMFVCPDGNELHKWFRIIYDFLEACPSTAALLPESSKRKFPVIDLTEMLVYGATSGGKSSLAGISIRYLYCTEIDKWSTDVSTEADSLFRALSRTKDWPNKKIIMESTPSVLGSSRIAQRLKEADVVLKYHVPCPLCGQFQTLRMGAAERGTGGLKWDHDKDGKSTPVLARESAFYECDHCSGKIEDRHRGEMFRAGVWAPEEYKVPEGAGGPVLFGRRGVQVVGMHLSSLYSPPPFMTWGELAENCVKMVRTREGIREWENEWMAHTFKEGTDAPHWTKIKEHLETEVPMGVVPEWATVLTGGADVGGTKCHYVIRAWGPGGKSQLVEFGIVKVLGDVRTAVYELAGVVLDKEYPQEKTGTVFKVRVLGMDARWYVSTPHVIEVCHKKYGFIMHGGRMAPLFGISAVTAAHSRWTPSMLRKNPSTGKPFPDGRAPETITVNSPYYQGWVNSKLKLSCSDEGAWMFHKDAPEEYLRGICNVVSRTKKNTRGLTTYEFVVLEDEWGDHAHDSEAYCSCVADIVGAMRIPKEKPPEAGYAIAAQEEKKAGGWKIGR